METIYENNPQEREETKNQEIEVDKEGLKNYLFSLLTEKQTKDINRFLTKGFPIKENGNQDGIIVQIEVIPAMRTCR